MRILSEKEKKRLEEEMPEAPAKSEKEQIKEQIKALGKKDKIAHYVRYYFVPVFFSALAVASVVFLIFTFLTKKETQVGIAYIDVPVEIEEILTEKAAEAVGDTSSKQGLVSVQRGQAEFSETIVAIQNILITGEFDLLVADEATVFSYGVQDQLLNMADHISTDEYEGEYLYQVGTEGTEHPVIYGVCLSDRVDLTVTEDDGRKIYAGLISYGAHTENGVKALKETLKATE